VIHVLELDADVGSDLLHEPFGPLRGEAERPRLHGLGTQDTHNCENELNTK